MIIIPSFVTSAIINGSTLVSEADEQFNIMMNEIKAYVENTYTSVANQVVSETQDIKDDTYALYEDFLSRYLGAYSSNPLVDTLGNPISIGALYFNTVDNELKVYNGTTFQPALADVLVKAENLNDLPDKSTARTNLDVYSKTEVDNKVAALVDAAPATLDTLNELAAALGDDPNFATTVATNIGNVNTDLQNHKTNTSNPHGVTKAQVGLGLADNTADASKNVLSATKWTTARTVTLSGDVAGSASIDGSANVTITTTVQPNSVALGTDTTGNYVAGATAGTGISITGTAGEGWSPVITNTAPNVTTDISITTSTTSVTVNSSDGADGIISSATNLAAGVMSASDKIKLDGIESGATADQTPAEILTAIKTVDGAASGLDADLLDGQHGSYYQPASTALTTSTAFGGDVSGTYNNIIVADDSHNHIISNVDGLQTALDGRIEKVVSTDNAVVRFNGTTGAVQDSGVYIDDGGNIGVGIAAATDGTIHIHESGITNSNIKFTNGTTGATAADGFFVGIGTDGKAYVYQRENLDLLFGTNNTTKMTLTATGDVTTTGTVNGRNMVTDGTKLDGIATGATANTGTVTSVATSGAITGGTITTTGTISHSTADGYLHVPATGTTNNGKVLTAGATAGSLSWTTLPSAPVTSVVGLTGAITTANVFDAIKTVDGSGSGLDADLLDGQEGSYYTNASNLSSGTIPDARISGSYTGMINLTGSGTVDFSKFLGNAADTVTAPSFSWTGDDNTGIYSPGADQVAVTTGGVQRALFNSSGISGVGSGLTSLTGNNIVWGTSNTAGKFYTGTTTPTGTTRLNYSGYLYPTMLNTGATADTSTAASHYFVETGSDGFVRPKTLANVRTEIVTKAAVEASGAVLGGGATGGGTDSVFYENDQVVTTSYSITAGKNAMSTGDVTINTGITVTVPTGSRWVII